jgi:hypothetical protein
MQKSFIFLSVILLFAACASEPKEILPNAADLLGHWEIVEGKRDSMPTSMLNGKTFDFTETDVTTELPMTMSDTSKSAFTFDGDSLHCAAFSANFKVASLHNDTMVLFTRLEKYQFMLTLLKR